MKLSTELKPRTDGTLRVLGLDGKTYVFKGDPLECDVDDERTLAHLLALDTFFPSSDDDHAAALALVDGMATSGGPAGDDLDDDDDQVDMNALPIEANTPPKVETAAALPIEANTPPKPAEQQRRTRAPRAAS